MYFNANRKVAKVRSSKCNFFQFQHFTKAISNIFVQRVTIPANFLYQKGVVEFLKPPFISVICLHLFRNA